MARKRMIDPHFFESAQDNKWNSDDCTVMLAAISCADDEGRGRLSALESTVKGIIPVKKFNKSIKFLKNSVKIYNKSYYFLPKWEEYQTVSHPTPSKFPKPNLNDNNELGLKNSRDFPETLQNDSGATPSQVKLSKGSLKESKGNELTFLKNFLEEKIIELFTDNTHIWRPDKEIHVKPLLELFTDLFTHKNENMTEEKIWSYINEVFTALPKDKGIRVDHLLRNIREKVIAAQEREAKKKKTALNGGNDVPRLSKRETEPEKYIRIMTESTLALIENHKDKLPEPIEVQARELVKNNKFYNARVLIEEYFESQNNVEETE